MAGNSTIRPLRRCGCGLLIRSGKVLIRRMWPRALGLHRKTVYGWLAKYREGGKDPAGSARPSRSPKLNGQQLSRLYALIAGRDPRQMQFEFALWTREMVREVIRREFGVALSCCQRRPRCCASSACRRNGHCTALTSRTLRQSTGGSASEYPAIQAQAEAASAVIYFADEAGIRSDYIRGTTWSPAGQTPQVKNTGARYSVNMISVVSAKGALRFAVYEENTNAAVFIDFCKRLLHDAPGPVYLIVDGHPAAPRHCYEGICCLCRRPPDAVLPAWLLARAESR